MTKRGKFYNHIGTETLVHCRDIRFDQRSTYNQLDKASIRGQAERGEEVDCRQPQRMPEKYEGPTGRKTSDRLRGIWPDRPSTTLFTETEVSSRGELEMENV